MPFLIVLYIVVSEEALWLYMWEKGMPAEQIAIFPRAVHCSFQALLSREDLCNLGFSAIYFQRLITL